MPTNATIDRRNEKLREEFRNLRMQNVPWRDAVADIAEQNGLSFSTVRKAVHGNKPDALPEDPLNEIPTAFATSTLIDPQTGDRKLIWIKEKKEKGEEVMRAMAESLAEGLPKVKASEPRSKKFRNDTIAVYPFGDPHVGMFAWGEEAGDDFDLKIAERQLCSAVDRLVDTVPACEQALIINLGDFFHADNLESRTARSGHALDTDTRWPKVLRVGIKAMRQCIESALKKHKHVHVINAIGNHDDHSAMFLSVALSNIYEGEPRVTVNDAPTIKHYHRFGQNLFAVHHGHTIKMQDLPLQMAIDRPQDWAEAKFRFAFTGHIHHDSKKEIGGVIVESFRTLAPKDAWHASKGYNSGRDMKSILFHSEFGEIERHTVNVEMLNG